MEILAFIGLIALVILLFVGGDLFGWIIKGFVEIVKFLFEGCGTTIAWIVFGIIIFGISCDNHFICQYLFMMARDRYVI